MNKQSEYVVFENSWTTSQRIMRALWYHTSELGPNSNVSSEAPLAMDTNPSTVAISSEWTLMMANIFTISMYARSCDDQRHAVRQDAPKVSGVHTPKLFSSREWLYQWTLVLLVHILHAPDRPCESIQQFSIRNPCHRKLFWWRMEGTTFYANGRGNKSQNMKAIGGSFISYFSSFGMFIYLIKLLTLKEMSVVNPQRNLQK